LLVASSTPGRIFTQGTLGKAACVGCAAASRAHTPLLSRLRPAGRAAGARGGGDEVFLPTRSLALLDAVAGALPAHTLLAADFDALPETRIAGANAPLVATTVRAGCRYRRAGCRGPPQRPPPLSACDDAVWAESCCLAGFRRVEGVSDSCAVVLGCRAL